MKGGWINSTRQMFGSMLRNNNNTQFGRKLLGNPGNSGIGPATSKGRRSAMNPVGVSMPKNLFGFAKSSFNRYTNNTPGMSLTEHMAHRAKQLNQFAESGNLAKLIDSNKTATKLANGVNSFGKDFSIARG